MVLLPILSHLATCFSLIDLFFLFLKKIFGAELLSLCIPAVYSIPVVELRQTEEAIVALLANPVHFINLFDTSSQQRVNTTHPREEPDPQLCLNSSCTGVCASRAQLLLVPKVGIT